MGLDKYFAIKNMNRISEKTLLTLAFFGGIGIWCGMYMFRHKTRKARFYIGVPILTISFMILISQLY